MLEELGRAITRLESCSLSSSPVLHLLRGQHKRFSPVLERIALCTAPRVTRILTEEAAESAEWILLMPVGNGRMVWLTETPAWDKYVAAVTAGLIMDTEYSRYVRAKDFSERLMAHSYISECHGRDYKTKRYEYALSPGGVPAWFLTDKAARWVEEIVTAYCFLVFSVLDFAAEHRRRAA